MAASGGCATNEGETLSDLGVFHPFAFLTAGQTPVSKTEAFVTQAVNHHAREVKPDLLSLPPTTAFTLVPTVSALTELAGGRAFAKDGDTHPTQPDFDIALQPVDDLAADDPYRLLITDDSTTDYLMFLGVRCGL